MLNSQISDPISTWEPGILGKRTILTTWEPGNTGKRMILIAWEPGNTRKRTILRICRIDTGGDGDGGDDGGVPTTLPSAQTPSPSRPGTEYPVRRIPHFDMATVQEDLSVNVVTGMGY